MELLYSWRAASVQEYFYLFAIAQVIAKLHPGNEIYYTCEFYENLYFRN